MDHLPKDYDEATDLIAYPKNKFILWTHDGNNVMWGNYGDGYFFGEDSNGVRVWGAYGNGHFSGYYDNEFFYGKYGKNHWKAYGLFGEKRSFGGFKLFSEDRPIPFPRPHEKSDRVDILPIEEPTTDFEGSFARLDKKPLRKNLLNTAN